MPQPDPRLVALGYDDATAEWFRDLPDAADKVPGRVARLDRGACVVLTADASVQAPLRRKSGAVPDVVTGDWIALAGDEESGWAVTGVAPRRSVIGRADPSRAGQQQPLAANVDAVFLVCGLDRPLRPGRIERALVLAWEGGAEPVVVLTKADLVPDPAGAEAEAAAAAPGVPIHVTSSADGFGLASLARALTPNRTAALIGESGAGKSTLVNRLVGGDVQAIGAVRVGDAKGRHTTTARYLVPLPDGGVLLDTPGLRQLGLWTGEDGLAAAFADIEALAAECRFGDCVHRTEPGCAVLAAVADGRLSERRLAGFSKLAREVEHQSGVVSDHERRRQGRQNQRVYRTAQDEKRRRR